MPLLTLISCGGPKPFDISNPTQRYITFGNGGGFTGAVTTHHLLEDGRIFREVNENETVEVGKIDGDLAKQQFNNYTLLNFQDVNINDPGNIYYFIKHSDFPEKRSITWGGNNTEVPSAISTFHLNLSKIVRSINENSKPYKSAQK